MINTKKLEADILFKNNEFDKALKIFQELEKLNPNNFDIITKIANLLELQHQYKNSINYYLKALKIKNNNIELLNKLSFVYSKINQDANALDCLLKIENKNEDTYFNIAINYQNLGDYCNSIRYYKKIIELNPNNFLAVYNLIKLDSKFLNLKLINKINSNIESKEISLEQKAAGYFIIASDFFAKKDKKSEIKNLIKAHETYYGINKIKNDTICNYYNNLLLKFVKKTEYKKMHIAKPVKNSLLKPIYIVGLPRSGSTLVESLLSSGKNKLHKGGEINVFNQVLIQNKIIIPSSKDDLNINFSNSNNELIDLFNKIYNRYYQLGLIDINCNYLFTDKSLENFYYIDLILTLFPKAKIINVERQVLSNIVGILKTFFGGNAWTHSIDEIFKYVDNYYKIISKFKKFYSDQILTINLTELTSNSSQVSKKIFDFCELEWDPKCLEFYKRKDLINKTASNIQLKKQIYAHDDSKYNPYNEILRKYGEQYEWFKNC